MERLMYPVYKCKNCGEKIVVKKISGFRNYKSISDALSSGFFDNQNNPKLHKCKDEFIHDGYDFYIMLEPIGFVKEKEREEVENEIGDGESNSGDKEGNRETDIDK